MKRINNIIKYSIKTIFYIFMLYPFCLISAVFPRDKKLWIFGSHNNTFSDNSKYFFWYVVDNAKNYVRPIWISGSKKIVSMLKEKGYESYYKWSIKGLWYSLRGGVYIYSAYSSDINFWTSVGALKINLWHGIPLKKIEYDVKVGNLGKKYNSNYKYFFKFFFPSSFQKSSYILSTSRNISKIFSNAFKVPLNRCLDFGYPRCEHFLYEKEKILSLIKEKELDVFDFINNVMMKYEKILLYMPTFRETGENDLNKFIHINEISNILEKKNWLLLIKQHPNLFLELKINHKNIKVLPSKFDVYLILPFTDGLITDYSSVMFDYILLNKPVFLFQYDREFYENNERGFYLDIKKKIESNFVRIDNFADFIKMIEGIKSIDYVHFINYLWKDYANPSKKLFDYLIRFCDNE